MRALASCLASIALACAESTPPAPTLEEVRGAIETQNRAFGEAVHAGDTASIGAMYTEDGAVLPPNAEKVSGRSAIAEFWGSALAGGVAGVVLTTEEVAYVGGEVATEVGSAVLSAKDGSVVDESKYLVLWKQTPDGWRMHRDIWNSSRTPAAPPPPDAANPAGAVHADPAAESP
jgi:uncharacterized protein (TIGR02246 family)